MSERKKEIRVVLTDDQFDQIAQHAERHGISRAEFLRNCAINNQGKPGNVRFDRDSYAKAVEAAAQAVPGISRAQLEHAVARVITTIAS